jgi:uncharacterized membrane protein HdeD (DUF308 family)
MRTIIGILLIIIGAFILFCESESLWTLILTKVLAIGLIWYGRRLYIIDDLRIKRNKEIEKRQGKAE